MSTEKGPLCKMKQLRTMSHAEPFWTCQIKFDFCGGHRCYGNTLWQGVYFSKRCGILVTEAHILPSGSGWGIIPKLRGEHKLNVKSLELLVFHHVYPKMFTIDWCCFDFGNVRCYICEKVILNFMVLSFVKVTKAWINLHCSERIQDNIVFVLLLLRRNTCLAITYCLIYLNNTTFVP